MYSRHYVKIMNWLGRRRASLAKARHRWANGALREDECCGRVPREPWSR